MIVEIDTLLGHEHFGGNGPPSSPGSWGWLGLEKASDHTG